MNNNIFMVEAFIVVILILRKEQFLFFSWKKQESDVDVEDDIEYLINRIVF